MGSVLSQEGAGQKATTLVFFDLESTGLAHIVGKSNVQITEISMVAMDRREFEECENSNLGDVRVMHKLSMCIKPRAQVSPKAAEITGLNGDNLRNQHTFDRNVGTAIISFLSHLPKPVCLVAHNGNEFDFPLLKSELNAQSLELPRGILVVDSLMILRAVGVESEEQITKYVRLNKNGKINLSLENLHLYFFKKRHFNRHSSEGDCFALAKVCHKLKDDLLILFDANAQPWTVVRPMW